MDGVGSVSFIRWNVSERRNVRVCDDVSLHKKRDECDMMILLNEERLFLCIYLREVIFEWLWFHIESLSSSSFISFWEIPNDESKSHSRWNCDENYRFYRSYRWSKLSTVITIDLPWDRPPMRWLHTNDAGSYDTYLFLSLRIFGLMLKGGKLDHLTPNLARIP